MRRREFIAGISAMATLPLVAPAMQAAGRNFKIGYLFIASREQTLHYIKAFEEGLRTLGYHVGENVVIEYRFTNGQAERLPALAAELVRVGVDVIVTGTNPNTDAVMKATTAIPIVMNSGLDPVNAGLVTSLARPGGNVTGLVLDTGDEIFGKRFELLKEILPNLSRVGVLFNPDVAFNRSRQTAAMGETARILGLTFIPVEARGPDALEQAFATMVKEHAQAFVMQGDGVLYDSRSRIAEMALRVQLPAVSGQRELATAGFLLTYGADIPDLCRRSAVFVDKIFKGTKPADLPVEQPTKFELVANLKTAKALGIVMPPSLLLRADDVIE
jgi:putative ABC transport system substrate-binding protein